MKVLFLGDIVARYGREAVKIAIPILREELAPDIVIVNGENAAGGSGIDKKCHKEIVSAGADLITLGDHTWRRPEVKKMLSEDDYLCIAPANYPKTSSFRSYITSDFGGVTVGVTSLLGRTFMSSSLDCPFQTAEKLLKGEFGKAKIKIVDFHAEATSEKIAFAKYFDGQLSLVVGTHTHVQTADEEILAAGTARITDLGMCGSHSGVIGLDKEVAIRRFQNGRPSSYKAAEGDLRVNGIIADIDSSTGMASSIERISRKLS